MRLQFVPESLVAALAARQDRNLTNGDVPPGFVEQNGRIVPFWYTREGIIIKWSIFWGILLLFILYLVLGNIHAKRRIKKGLRPLAYHRWLVSRADMARVDPAYAYPQSTYTNYRPYPPGDYYGMHHMPPPVYDPNAPRPPIYDPNTMPAGATKVDPSQWRAEPTRRPADQPQQSGVEEQYESPVGPPPAALRPEGTGNTNPFRG